MSNQETQLTQTPQEVSYNQQNEIETSNQTTQALGNEELESVTGGIESPPLKTTLYQYDRVDNSGDGVAQKVGFMKKHGKKLLVGGGVVAAVSTIGAGTAIIATTGKKSPPAQ